MSNVWICVPSARPVAEVREWAAKWHERGYKVAIWRDNPEDRQLIDSVKVMTGIYHGYAATTNALIGYALCLDPWCDWVVAGGDDVFPDAAHTADQIAYQCGRRFGEQQEIYRMEYVTGTEPMPPQPSCRMPWSTFGVMQPIGDLYGERDPWPPGTPANRRTYASRVCGSPWLGREWCLRGNQGKGPFHPDFYHMHGDQCLQEVAEKLGILWQRPDLTHYHNHWARKRQNQADMPDFLRNVNSQEHWKESKALLDRLRTDGFKECLPIP